jgi:hypothetical protein
MWCSRGIAVLAVAAGLGLPQGAQAFGPLGGDFRISFMGPDGTSGFDAGESSVAYNPAANEYLVVWSGDDNTPPLVDNELEIFAQRVAANGARLGGRIRVSEQGANGNPDTSARLPSVAYNRAANEYLVVWQGEDGVSDELEIWGQRLSAAGAEVGGIDFRISDMGPDGNRDYNATQATVVANPSANEYLVVWEGDDNTPPLVNDEFEVFGQRLTASGQQTGANDFRISEQGMDGNAASDAGNPGVAYNPATNEYLAAWSGEIGTSNEIEIWAQRLSAAGAEVGGNDFQISDMGPDGSANYGVNDAGVAANPNTRQYLVVWEADDNTGPLVDNEFEIFGQRLTGGGQQVGANDFRISDMGPNGSASYEAGSPRVAYGSTGDRYLVVWDGDDNTGPLVDNEFEVFGQRLTAGGDPTGANDFRISNMGPDGYTSFEAADPSVAYGSTANQFLAVWEGDDGASPLVDNEFEIFGQRLGEPQAPGGGGRPSPGSDTRAPRFLSLGLSPSAFAASRSGPSVRTGRGRGTRVTYRLSEAARTTFRVQRVLPGRRVRGRCVRPTRSNRGKRSCRRHRTLRGSFHDKASAGRNRFRFSGRLAGHALRPGAYRLVATAKDSAGNRSRPARRPFRIIR